MNCSICTFKNIIGTNYCNACGFELLNSHSATALNLKLEEFKQKKIINDNKIAAYETIPESLFPVNMLYFPVSINGIKLNAFVDTGAQISIMSGKTAKKCNINYLIDKEYRGIVKGVGTQNIRGKIHLMDILIDNKGTSLPCSFTIIDDNDGPDIIFGLDMLKSHGILIDLKKNHMILDSLIIKFIKI